jgi:DNA-binding NarL/FixJ family response regulator
MIIVESIDLLHRACLVIPPLEVILLPMSIRLLLVDDHEVVRLGMKVLLDRLQGFTVVAEAENEDEAVEQAVLHEPDIVIMDIRLAGGSGIEACHKIK